MMNHWIYCRLPSGKLTWQWKMDHLEDVFPIKNGDISLPWPSLLEGRFPKWRLFASSFKCQYEIVGRFWGSDTSPPLKDVGYVGFVREMLRVLWQTVNTPKIIQIHDVDVRTKSQPTIQKMKPSHEYLAANGSDPYSCSSTFSQQSKISGVKKTYLRCWYRGPLNGQFFLPTSQWS